MPQSVFKKFGIPNDSLIKPFGSGLINHTWFVETKNNQKYILQKVNENVFKHPENIAENIRLIAHYLSLHSPLYFFPTPLKSLEGAEFIIEEGKGFFRLFNFVENSHSFDVVESPKQAYESAKAFGKFTRLLAGMEISALKTTLPHFHDLSFRYRAFITSLENASKERKELAEEAIGFMMSHKYLVEDFEDIKKNKGFKLRVTHHDTKISNVLFDESENALCIIDLDTVMAGYFISDLGDMMRTYLCPVSEEDQNLRLIDVREEYLKAILEGYLSEMKDELTEIEKKYLLFSGHFIIYMQAMRFITDFLNHDIYYGAKYPLHNLIRGMNQITLFRKLKEKEALLNFNNHHLVQS